MSEDNENAQVPPLEGVTLHNVSWLADEYEPGAEDRRIVKDVDDANVISSMLTGDENKKPEDRMHKVILDIDHNAKLIPSSTPGHYHLYIDVEIPHDDYMQMLRSMSYAGVIQPGYYGASERRGYTSARLPWIKKEQKNG